MKFSFAEVYARSSFRGREAKGLTQMSTGMLLADDKMHRWSILQVKMSSQDLACVCDTVKAGRVLWWLLSALYQTFRVLGSGEAADRLLSRSQCMVRFQASAKSSVPPQKR